MPKCGLIVRCRFAVRTNRRRLRGGDGCKTQDFPGIARAIRVMYEAGGRDTRPPRKNHEHSCMQTLLAQRRERVFERAPRKLVPEGERGVLIAHHADAEAALDARFIRASGQLQQPAFSLPGDYADELRDFACRNGEPRRARKHGITHGDRHGIGNRGQYFGNEKWIATRDTVQSFRRSSGAPCELLDCKF